jgi:hypothetical protein
MEMLERLETSVEAESENLTLQAGGPPTRAPTEEELAQSPWRRKKAEAAA